MAADEDRYVRLEAANALGKAFSQVPDKTLAWQDLIRLTQDGDSDVRRGATKALGEAFSHVPASGAGKKKLGELMRMQFY